MLDRVVLSGAPSFAAAGCALENLGRFNFVFGPNGTGKTTISRVIGDPNLHPGAGYRVRPGSSPVTHVYNRDYVTRTLQDASRLPGVFILDDEDPVARKEFMDLTAPGGTISQLEQTVKATVDNLGALQNQLDRARSDLVETAWKARPQIPDELQPMFDGYKGSKDTFATKLIGVVKAEVPDVQDLLREAHSAFDSAGHPETTIASMPDCSDLLSVPGATLLGTPIAGSADVTLADLVRRLGSQDWVSEGRKFLEHSDGSCPFCQQALPFEFLKHLAEFFDDEFARKMSEIAVLGEQSAITYGTLRARIEGLESYSSFLEEETAKLASDTLRATIDENEEAISVKLATPTATVAILDLTEPLSQMDAVIAAANRRIAEHNSRLENRTAAKASLVERCWTYFGWGVVVAEMSGYLGVLSGTQVRKSELESERVTATIALEGAQLRAQTLEASLVSTAPAIERVNRLLHSVGFRRFQLAKSDEVKDGYRLQRVDGSAAAETLSDGERTFIAFLYYFVQLEGRHRSATAGALVAIVDDPISSLDSDVLFVVGSLIRRLVQMIHSGSGRLAQIVVLTHNVQFYIELTYPRSKDKRLGLTAGRRFYELQRDVNGDTVIIGADTNDVRSNYQRLWRVVQRASSDPGPGDAGLENVLRRILENYFTVIGNYPDLDELMESSVHDDAIACRSLLAWLHHGSHTLVDDFDYSPSGISKGVFLRVFKEIFEKTDQKGHYEMMMSEI